MISSLTVAVPKPETRKGKEVAETRARKRVEVHSSRAMRLFLFFLGTLFVVIAVVGVILPVLPTTPFLLLATACYARSSDRFYNVLLNNRVFGPIIDDWHSNHCIKPRVKAVAVSMIILFISFSAIFVIKPPYLKITMGVVALGVIIFILSFPSAPKGERG